MAERILIISPIPVLPEHAGNRKRIRTICSELMSRGYHLDFFYTGFDAPPNSEHNSFFNGVVLRHEVGESKVNGFVHPLKRISELLNGFIIRGHKLFRLFADSYDSARYNKCLLEYQNAKKFALLREQVSDNSYKAVIVNYAVYSFYFDLFDDSTIKIIDTHDQLSDRYKMYLEQDYKPVNWYSLRYKDEQKAVSRADVVWAITDEEKKHFKKMTDSDQTRVYTLRHLLPFRNVLSKESGKRILMIGSGNRLNIDGLNWFLECVWPGLKKSLTGIKLIIAGSICDVLEKIEDDEIQLFGLFEDPDEVYSLTDLCINPMQSGTGLKIKTYEALAHGKIVISTTSGATGLSEYIGHGLVCSDNASIWNERILLLLNESEMRKELQDKTEVITTKIYKKNLNVISDSLTYGVHEKTD